MLTSSRRLRYARWRSLINPLYGKKEALGLGAIKTFLEIHREEFDFEGQGENSMMRLRSTAHRSKPKISNRLAAVHRQRRCVAEEWTSTLGTQLKLPRFGLSLWRWPTQKITKILYQNSTLLRRRPALQDVAASLHHCAVRPSELPMIGIVRREMKWYSRNNRRLWCFQKAKGEAVKVCMPLVDTAFLHGLTPTSAAHKECAKEFVNQKSLRKHNLCSHKCVREGELPRPPFWRNSTTVTFVT